VAGGGGQRAGLAPAGHAAIDEARVGGQAVVGPEAEALHHAGAVAFDEAVGRGDQLAGGGEAFGLLEVEGDDPAVAVEDVDAGSKSSDAGLAPGASLRSMRTTSAPRSARIIAPSGGAEGGEFDDLDAVKRAHAVSLF
jgi:hypothetical protein